MSDPNHDPVASTDTPDEAALAQVRAKAGEGIVVCDACPVLCRIRPGKTGACDRYGNVDGKLARLDPFVVAQRTIDHELRTGSPYPLDETSASVPAAVRRPGATFVTLERGTALQDESGHWKQFEYAVLIALDRPKDLEKVLQKWVDAGDADAGGDERRARLG